MWVFKKELKNISVSVLVDEARNLLRRYFPVGSFKDGSDSCLELFDIENFDKPVWVKNAAPNSYISGVFGGVIYGTLDEKHLYRISKNRGAERVLENVTRGVLYEKSLFLTSTKEPKAIKLFDFNTQKELWALPLSKNNFCLSFGSLGDGFDFIVISNIQEKSWEALNPKSGDTLWSLTFLEGFDYNSSAVVGDYLYLLYQQDRGETTYDGFNIHYRVLHVHDKNTGQLVRVYEDVPGYSGLNAHHPTGGIFICGADKLYSIQPMVDDEFSCYPVKIAGVDEIYAAKVAGVTDTQIMFYAHRYDWGSPVTQDYGIVHFDVVKKQFVYGQALENKYGRNPKLEVQHGFLFVTDVNANMHIFKWADA